MAWTAHKNPETIKEVTEDEHSIETKAKEVADLIRSSKHTVFFTGAGISTSAGIPDFRGPQGVWTLAAKGEERTESTTPLLKALPTPTHMSLVSLLDNNLAQFIISQNIDGLHRKSGVHPEKLAELHGNTNLEICRKCDRQYLRDFDVSQHHVTNVHDHRTGRRCAIPDCGGELHDSIINFKENLPEVPLKLGFWHSHNAQLHIVLGSSLTVSPACDMPKMTADQGGKLVIVNMQKTPLDSKCHTRVYARCDDFMSRVMSHLKLDIPQWKLKRRVLIDNHFNSDKQNFTVRIQGIDDMDTPSSFISKITVNDSNILNKEPFVLGTFKSTVDEDIEFKLKLEFMGHYMEPELEILHQLNTKKSSAIVFQLEYDPFKRLWTQTHSDFVPAKPSDYEEVLKKIREVTIAPPDDSQITSPSTGNFGGMFAVDPKPDCPHLQNSFTLDKSKQEAIKIPSPCIECKDERENWVCLTCYEIRCSRYVNGHQNDHFKQTGHCIAASFSDLSVWCYNCDSYIKHSTLRPFLKQLCDVKFGPQ